MKPGEIPNQGTEQHEEISRVESLLRVAATWEPNRAAPEDLVARAMQRHRRNSGGLALSRLRDVFAGGMGGGTAWWTMGSVGVAAAATLMVTTGRLVSPSGAPTLPPSVPSQTTLQPHQAMYSPQETGTDVVPPGKPASASRIVASVSTEDTEPERNRRVRFNTRSRVNREARAEKDTADTPNEKSAATPKTSDRTVVLPSAPPPLPKNAIALDEAPIVVPVVFEETSADGTQIRRTPVALAFSDGTASGDYTMDADGMISLE